MGCDESFLEQVQIDCLVLHGGRQHAQSEVQQVDLSISVDHIRCCQIAMNDADPMKSLYNVAQFAGYLIDLSFIPIDVIFKLCAFDVLQHDLVRLRHNFQHFGDLDAAFQGLL